MAAQFEHNGAQYRRYSREADGFDGHERRDRIRPGRDRYVQIDGRQYWGAYVEHLAAAGRLDELSAQFASQLRRYLGDPDIFEEAQALRDDLRLNAPDGC